MNRGWKAVVCALAVASICSDLTCAAFADSDECCQAVTCSLCTQSAIHVQDQPLLSVSFVFNPTVVVEFAEPPAPDLAHLAPPPKFVV